MDNLTITFHGLRQLIKNVRTAQIDYFKAKAKQLDAHSRLKECKKLEKELDETLAFVDKVEREAQQANLFEPVYMNSIVRKGFTNPKLLAEYYGQEVTFEWLTNGGATWVEQTGKVNAITIRMAEMERVRQLSVNGKEVQNA